MKKDLVRLAGIAAVLVAVLLVAAAFYARSQKQEQEAKVAQQVAASPKGAGDDSAFVRPHSPTQGPKDAKVTIVEFLDPECESCRAMYPMVKHLLSEYGNRVRLVVRYMPLHPNSLKAIAALQAATEQGRYWEMLETLFVNQPRWGDHHAPRPELIPQLAEQVGLDMAAYQRSVATEVHRNIADTDRKDGESLGVRGTPTFFVNTRRLETLGYETLKALIDEELAK
jgi:protein-disulfide isomerase